LILQPNPQICNQGVAGSNPAAGTKKIEVEVVATYKLFNINRAKLESLLHRFFSPARLDVEIPDRFGRAVKPREWFLVPLHGIDEVVARRTGRSGPPWRSRHAPTLRRLSRRSCE
jgi:Meiotically up-regulated gene 113